MLYPTTTRARRPRKVYEMVDISLSITCTAFLRFWELAILVTRRGLPAGWKETRSAVQCHPAGSLSGWDGPRIPGTMAICRPQSSPDHCWAFLCCSLFSEIVKALFSLFKPVTLLCDEASSPGRL